MIILLIILGIIFSYFAFNNVLWRIGLKYNFNTARNEVFGYHFLGLIWFLASASEFDWKPFQKTVDKYDPEIKRRLEKAESNDRMNLYSDIIAKEIELGMRDHGDYFIDISGVKTYVDIHRNYS